LLGNGNGTYQQADVAATPGTMLYDVEIRDVNGDGDKDLVFSSGDTDNFNYNNGTPPAFGTTQSGLAVALGNGDGSFGALMTFNNTPTVAGEVASSFDLASADLNGDGRTDYVSGNGNFASIFLANADGTFNTAYTYVASDVAQVSIGDLNNDGENDILLQGNTGRYTILNGNGDGTFAVGASSLTDVISNPSEVTLADTNGDGNLDRIYSTYGGTSQAGVSLGNGNGTFKAAITLALETPGTVKSFVYDDFTEDGTKDFLGASWGQDSILFSEMGTTTSSGSTTSQIAVEFDTRIYEDIFDNNRNILTRPNAYAVLHDLLALRKQITNNLKEIDNTKQALVENLKLTRSVGLGMLEIADTITGAASASQIASKLSHLIRGQASGALDAIGNLTSITDAASRLNSISGDD
jgi:hypothetical protein